MSDRDDDALSWAGDEFESAASGDHAGAVIRGERGSAVRGVAAPADAEHEVAREVGGSLALLAYGIAAGAYALLTIGWFVAVSTSTITASSIVGEVFYQAGQWLAVAAPAIWFTATVALTREGRVAVRLLWLVIGLMLLVPWPYLTAPGGGA